MKKKDEERERERTTHSAVRPIRHTERQRADFELPHLTSYSLSILAKQDGP